MPPITRITSGNRFSLGLNEENDLYVWGSGEYGVFGDGNNKDALIPRKSEFFK